MYYIVSNGEDISMLCHNMCYIVSNGEDISMLYVTTYVIL